MKLTIVSAGTTSPSSTRLLADRLTESLTKQLGDGDGEELEVHVVELRDVAVDIAKNMVTGFPSPALQAELDAVTGADGVIAVTPVYSASYSGLFKSFFDVIDGGALAGLPVLIAATGGTPRHSLALDHALRPLLSYLRATVMPTGVYAASQDWGGEDASELHTRIDRAAGELADAMAGTPRSRRASDGFSDFVPFEQQLANLGQLDV
ncbi:MULTISPECIES: FMN reductase [Prauserella salsuginis group]|uniref:FMN reductase n=2 Tax=Prauserella salsuginis group TaxID=2893672 RepID=A0A839XJ61_9PSEU|nr:MULTISPECIES: FMN reductase [Prauserella salsuginis group]MBB3663972.1 FMN reductase [Prauserella sediminis]MCR3721428.1 FMN reductase [Prauserella flava]MCR3732418.1 FMN reductase [Prauserella salsuginis]